MAQPPEAPTFDISEARDAFARLRTEIQAVSPAQRRSVDLDVPTAVAAILGSLPRMEALKPRIAMHLGTFDLARFEKMRAYTLALAHAHSELLIAREGANVAEGQSQDEGNAQRAFAERDQVFTLFIEAYEDARQAAEYLAPHSADSWVPNLYDMGGENDQGMGGVQA